MSLRINQLKIARNKCVQIEAKWNLLHLVFGSELKVIRIPRAKHGFMTKMWEICLFLHEFRKNPWTVDMLLNVTCNDCSTMEIPTKYFVIWIASGTMCWSAFVVYLKNFSDVQSRAVLKLSHLLKPCFQVRAGCSCKHLVK